MPHFRHYNTARNLPTAGAASWAFDEFGVPHAQGPFGRPRFTLRVPGPQEDTYVHTGPYVPGFGLGQSAWTFRLPAQPALPLLSEAQSRMLSGANMPAGSNIALAPAPSQATAPWYTRLFPKIKPQG